MYFRRSYIWYFINSFVIKSTYCAIGVGYIQLCFFLRYLCKTYLQLMTFQDMLSSQLYNIKLT